MIESVIYTSENKNLYIYNEQHRLSMLVHPEFEKAYDKSINADPYYKNKYAYLRQHSFFEDPKLVDYIKLEESMIKESIIHAKQVVFEATDSCNLNCTYCSLGESYDGYDERINKKINTRYAENLLKYIFDLKPKNKNNKLFISFYGGEALLNMAFIKQIVKVANQLNISKEMDLMFTMTTNATLINKYIDFLAANKFHILISLDGNEKNHSYRIFRKNKKNSFQKVIENLDMIQRDYPEYFSTNVNFNAVLHDRNTVREICEFIYARYKKIPRITELNMRDIKSDNIYLLERMFHSLRKSEAEFQKENIRLSEIMHSNLSSYRELTNFLKYFSINYYLSNLNSLFHLEEKQLPTCTCIPFSRKLFLTNRNKLLPCERINYKYSLGKVNNEIEINISEITRQYNFYYEHIKRYCQSCYAYRFCGACLFHIKNIDNVDTEGFVCDHFLDQELFKRKLHNIFSFLEKYPNDFSEILEIKIFE